MSDVTTGWYDAGVVEGIKNKLVPSISLKMKNVGPTIPGSIQLNAVFRLVGETEELGSAFLRAVDSNGLASSAASETIVLRCTQGYTGTEPRAQMLQNSQFVDAKVDVFAKYGSAQWVKLGDTRSRVSFSHVDRPPALTSTALDRRLGPVDAAAIVISNVIGVGIFATRAFVASLAPAPWAMIGVWVAGGVLAFAGAMVYAELAALRPRSGGENAYLREAFGPLAAFLTGWTSFVAGFSGAVALSAVLLAANLGRFFPAAQDTAAIVSVPLGLVTLTISPRAIVAMTVILGMSSSTSAGWGRGGSCRTR